MFSVEFTAKKKSSCFNRALSSGNWWRQNSVEITEYNETMKITIYSIEKNVWGHDHLKKIKSNYFWVNSKNSAKRRRRWHKILNGRRWRDNHWCFFLYGAYRLRAHLECALSRGFARLRATVTFFNDILSLFLFFRWTCANSNTDVTVLLNTQNGRGNYYYYCSYQ